jgi:predicted Ser/Thr protein kinase
MAPVDVGSVIAGKYRVERVLGQGGMGIVVAARHLRLGERVAIKFPVAQPRDRGDVVARLVREGRAAMRIRSEHVARVYDVGVLATGEPFLVMEYLVGRDLGATLADAGPLAVADAVEYVLQSLEALAEAHAYGIVHRDIKPSNLFLTHRADGSAMVKVIDFGISKLTKIDGEATLTDTAAVLGSRPFMAPEQMRSGRDIDARSDIWALGATLHALLTGTPPFLGGSIIEIHERILVGPPLLRSVRPDAPAALEAVLIRCMRRDPAERYANVAELAQALAAVAPPHAQISAQRAARIFSGSLLALASGEAFGDATDADGRTDGTVGDGTRATDLPLDASWRDTGASAGRPLGAQTGPVPPIATTTTPTAWRGSRLRRAGWFGLAALFIGGATLAFAGMRRGGSSSAHARIEALPPAIAFTAVPPPAAPPPDVATPPVEPPSPRPAAPSARGGPRFSRSAPAKRSADVPASFAGPRALRASVHRPPHDLLADPD